MANKHFVFLNFLGAKKKGVVDEIANTCTQCSCSIHEAQLITTAEDMTGFFYISGDWSAIAKIETAVVALEESTGIQLMCKRTSKRHHSTSPSIPYEVNLTTFDRPGILSDILCFFTALNLDLIDINSSSYYASKTQTQMISLSISISVPHDYPIMNLREQFILYCENQDLDATLDPLRY